MSLGSGSMVAGGRGIEEIPALQALRLEVTKPARWTGSLQALQKRRRREAGQGLFGWKMETPRGWG